MQSGKRGQTDRGRAEEVGGNQGMTHGKISGEIRAGLRGRSSRRQMEEGRGSVQTEGFSLEIDCCVTSTTVVRYLAETRKYVIFSPLCPTNKLDTFTTKNIYAMFNILRFCSSCFF